jgi:hypothetical protein
MTSGTILPRSKPPAWEFTSSRNSYRGNSIHGKLLARVRIHSLSAVFGHTHSAYTHLAGTHLNGYNVEVLKIIRHPHFKGEQTVDEITGQLVDRSDQKRPAVPFTLSTQDSYLTDPEHLGAILRTLERELTAGSSPITLVYPNAH